MRTKKAHRPAIIRRSPIFSVLFAAAIGTVIAYNALAKQEGKHPAPIVQTWETTGGTRQDTLNVVPPKVTAVVNTATELRRANEPSRAEAHLVGSLQRELMTLGYYTGKLDGEPGPATAEAVRTYQRKFGLNETGLASESLLYHIQFNRRVIEATRMPADPTADQGDGKIELVQTGLSELGYSPGPIDGVMGDKTQQAIRQFERDRSLPVTGQLSETLLEELHKVTGISALHAG